MGYSFRIKKIVELNSLYHYPGKERKRKALRFSKRQVCDKIDKCKLVNKGWKNNERITI